MTGSSGHLGEALVRVLSSEGFDVVGLDVVGSRFTALQGSVMDRALLQDALTGVDAVMHTAALHKPHVATRSRQEFVDVNVTGTLNLLEEAISSGVGCFIYTSTTSVFGRSLTPPPGAPAAWVTEETIPLARNIYGATKLAAEDLCELFHQEAGLSCVILRTSRFFPESDDSPEIQKAFGDANAKVNELLYRRVDLEDVVSAHLAALEKALQTGFGRYVISATSPFKRKDLADLRFGAGSVVKRLFPRYEDIYEERGWRMFPSIDRVYVNDRAREELGWSPRYGFASALDALESNSEYRSPLARRVGFKGY